MLTKSEIILLQYIVNHGFGSREALATELKLSVSTIKNRLHSIHEKLGRTTTLDSVLAALKLGVIKI